MNKTFQKSDCKNKADRFSLQSSDKKGTRLQKQQPANFVALFLITGKAAILRYRNTLPDVIIHWNYNSTVPI